MSDLNEIVSKLNSNNPKFNGENFPIWFGAMQRTMPQSARYLTVVGELLQANENNKLPNISQLRNYFASEAARKLFSDSERTSIESTLYNASQNFLAPDELVSAAATSKFHATDSSWTPNQQATKIKTSPGSGDSPEASRCTGGPSSGYMQTIFAAESDDEVNAWWRRRLPLFDKATIKALVTFYANSPATNLHNDAIAHHHLKRCLEMQHPEIQKFLMAANSSPPDVEGADYFHLLSNLFERYCLLSPQAVKDAEDNLNRTIFSWDEYRGNFSAYFQDVKASRSQVSDVYRRARFVGPTQNGATDFNYASTIAAAFGLTANSVPNFAQWQTLGIALHREVDARPQDALQLVEEFKRKALDLAGTSYGQQFVKSNLAAAGGRGGIAQDATTAGTTQGRATFRRGNTGTSMIATQQLTRADTTTIGNQGDSVFDSFRQLQQLPPTFSATPAVMSTDTVLSRDQFQALIATLTDTISEQVKETLKAEAVRSETKKSHQGSGPRLGQRQDPVTSYRQKQEANRRSNQVHAQGPSKGSPAVAADGAGCTFCGTSHNPEVRAQAHTHSDETCGRKREWRNSRPHKFGDYKRAERMDLATTTAQHNASGFEVEPPRTSALDAPRRRDGAHMACTSSSEMVGRFEEVSSGSDEESKFGSAQYAGVAEVVVDDTRDFAQPEHPVGNLPGDGKWKDSFNLTTDNIADLLRDLCRQPEYAAAYLFDLVQSRVNACSLAKTEALAEALSRKIFDALTTEELAQAISSEAAFHQVVAQVSTDKHCVQPDPQLSSLYEAGTASSSIQPTTRDANVAKVLSESEAAVSESAPESLVPVFAQEDLVAKVAITVPTVQTYYSTALKLLEGNPIFQSDRSTGAMQELFQEFQQLSCGFPFTSDSQPSSAQSEPCDFIEPESSPSVEGPKIVSGSEAQQACGWNNRREVSGSPDDCDVPVPMLGRAISTGFSESMINGDGRDGINFESDAAESGSESPDSTFGSSAQVSAVEVPMPEVTFSSGALPCGGIVDGVNQKYTDNSDVHSDTIYNGGHGSNQCAETVGYSSEGQDTAEADEGEHIEEDVGKHVLKYPAYLIRFLPTCSDHKAADYLSFQPDDGLPLVFSLISKATGVLAQQLRVRCDQLPGIEREVLPTHKLGYISQVSMRLYCSLFQSSGIRLYLDVVEILSNCGTTTQGINASEGANCLSESHRTLGTLHVDQVIFDTDSILPVAWTSTPFFEGFPIGNHRYIANPFVNQTACTSATWQIQFQSYGSCPSFNLVRPMSTVHDIKAMLVELLGWSQYTACHNQAFFLNGYFVGDSILLRDLPFETATPPQRASVPVRIEVCTNLPLLKGSRLWLGTCFVKALSWHTDHDGVQTCVCGKRKYPYDVLDDRGSGSSSDDSTANDASAHGISAGNPFQIDSSVVYHGRLATADGRREAARARIQRMVSTAQRRSLTELVANGSSRDSNQTNQTTPTEVLDCLRTELDALQSQQARYATSTGSSTDSCLRRVDLLLAQVRSQVRLNTHQVTLLARNATHAWPGSDVSWEPRNLQLIIRWTNAVVTLDTLNTFSTLSDLHLALFGSSAVSLLPQLPRLVYHGRTVPNCRHTDLIDILHDDDVTFTVEAQLRRGMSPNDSQAVDENTLPLVVSSNSAHLPLDAAYLKLVYSSVLLDRDFLLCEDRQPAQYLLNLLRDMPSPALLDPMDFYPKTGVHVSVQPNGFCLFSSLEYLGFSTRVLKLAIVRLLETDPLRLITPFHTARDLLLDGYGLDVSIQEQREQLVFKLRLLTFDPADEVLPASGWPNDSLILIIAHVLARTILLYSYKLDSAGFACLTAVYPCWFRLRSPDAMPAPVSLFFGATPGDAPLCIDKFGFVKDPHMFENTHFDPLVCGVISGDDLNGKPVLALEHPFSANPDPSVEHLVESSSSSPPALDLVGTLTDDSEDSILAIAFPALQAYTCVANIVPIALPDPVDNANIPAMSSLHDLVVSVDDSLARQYAESQECVSRLAAENASLRRTLVEASQLIRSEIALASGITDRLYEACAESLVRVALQQALHNVTVCSHPVDVAQLNTQELPYQQALDRIDQLQADHDLLLTQVNSLQTLRDRDAAASRQREQELIDERDSLTDRHRCLSYLLAQARSAQEEQALLLATKADDILSLHQRIADLETSLFSVQEHSCEVQRGLFALRKEDADRFAADQAILNQQLLAVQCDLEMCRQREQRLLHELTGVREQNVKLTACLNGDPFPHMRSTLDPVDLAANMPTLTSLQVQLHGLRQVVDDIRGILPPAVLRPIRHTYVQTDPLHSSSHSQHRPLRFPVGPKPISRHVHKVAPSSASPSISPVARRTRSGLLRKSVAPPTGMVKSGPSDQTMKQVLSFPAARLNRSLYLRLFAHDDHRLLLERDCWNASRVADWLSSSSPDYSDFTDKLNLSTAVLHRNWILCQRVFGYLRTQCATPSYREPEMSGLRIPSPVTSPLSPFTMPDFRGNVFSASDALYSTVSPRIDSALEQLERLSPHVTSLSSLFNSSMTSLFNSVSPVKPSQRERESGVDATNTHLSERLASRLQEDGGSPKECSFCSTSKHANIRNQAGTHTVRNCFRRADIRAKRNKTEQRKSGQKNLN